ncbi:MAG: N-acyl-D-amino-acid deacylase family protein [Pseudomonadales bacterium]
MLDLIIENGTIIDGSGAPGYSGSVGIKDGKITHLGEITEDATERLDASGKVVSPGFVDVHTHYDAQAFWDGTLSPSCYHGVTTVFGGFCGFSIAPLSEEAAPYLLNMLARVEGMPVNSLQEGVPWNWRTFGEYLNQLDGTLGVNAGFMAGHSAIRRVVMGERAVGDKATAQELEAMQALLGQSLAEGAMGFSSTISPTHNDADGQPVPSRHASREELVALAGVCREYPGTSLEFLPGVGFFSDEIKQLMSDLSTAAQRPLNWNVLAAGDAALMENQLSATDVARQNGGEVLALTVPQPITLRINLYGGFVFDAFDGWAELFQMPVSERIEALRDPANRERLDRSARDKGPMRNLAVWEDMTVDAVFDEQHKDLEGKSLGQLAQETGRSAFDCMLDLAISEGLKTSFMPPPIGGDESLWEARGKLWADDRTLIGASDAGAHLDMIDTFAFSTQVLGNGVRRYGVISLEAAIHQMTQVPAETFGLVDRGLLKPGWHADVVVFDPQTVGSGPVYMKTDLPCDEARVYADAYGIEHVFVNGVQIVREGEHTQQLPGTVLRSGKDTQTPSLRRVWER